MVLPRSAQPYEKESTHIDATVPRAKRTLDVLIEIIGAPDAPRATGGDAFFCTVDPLGDGLWQEMLAPLRLLLWPRDPH